MATSTRKISSNRRNAKNSSGPRTLVGKQTVSKNARTHGLNVPLPSDSPLQADIEALAVGLAAGDPGKLLDARSAAEAEITIRRVQMFKRIAIDLAWSRLIEGAGGRGFRCLE